MVSQPAPLGHDASGTAYDRRGSIEDDEHADEHYGDALTERVNLRVPEWMYWDIESVSDANRMDTSEAARELIERALAAWGPHVEFDADRHTYGDCKCPRCANENPPGLRWRRDPDRLSGVSVSCAACGYTDDVMVFRRMEQLDRAHETVWLSWSLTASGFDEYRSASDVRDRFREFIEDVEAFVVSDDLWEGADDARERARKALAGGGE